MARGGVLGLVCMSGEELGGRKGGREASTSATITQDTAFPDAPLDLHRGRGGSLVPHGEAMAAEVEIGDAREYSLIRFFFP